MKISIWTLKVVFWSFFGELQNENGNFLHNLSHVVIYLLIWKKVA